MELMKKYGHQRRFYGPKNIIYDYTFTNFSIKFSAPIEDLSGGVDLLKVYQKRNRPIELDYKYPLFA